MCPDEVNPPYYLFPYRYNYPLNDLFPTVKAIFVLNPELRLDADYPVKNMADGMQIFLSGFFLSL
jgi:hypothetical protein